MSVWGMKVVVVLVRGRHWLLFAWGRWIHACGEEIARGASL